ncbi:MAG: TlpA family protein disulfide reductase [Bacteroidales bacterium]
MNNKKLKLGALLLGLAIGATSLPAFASGAKGNKENKAPAFSYPSMDKAKSYSPNDFKGEFLLLDFWASWCPPCNAATPELKRLYSQYEKKGFEILGVSIDGDEQAWRKSVADKELKWANIITSDKGKKVSTLYGFNAIPYFVLLDKEGNILDKGFSINQLSDILKSTIK